MLYPWLRAEDAPRMIAEAVATLGVKEMAGRAQNPTITGWAKEPWARAIGLDRVYLFEETPWCGLWMARVAHRAGKPVVKDPLWARNWARFGEVSPLPSLGDVLVFSRQGGGGHIGLYVAEDDESYLVLGGNQGDRVSVVRIAKSRCIACRRPPYRNQPASVVPHLVDRAGAPLSQNEA